LSLGGERLPSGDVALIFVAVSRDGCHYPVVFELPIQLNGTAFQLKRSVRASQEAQPNGSCVESFAAVYKPEDFQPLGAVSSLVIHLPTGPIALPAPALQYVKALTPAVPSPGREFQSSDYLTAISRASMLIAGGRASEALEVTEDMAPLFAARPASEGLPFWGTLGMARRATSNLEGAARCYEIALLIADATGNASGDVGVIADNLATVNRLQHRWDAALAASDRALTVLTKAGAPARGELGAALNNRALLLSDQGRYADALAYSDHALVILREALRGDESALAPFLEDNRVIRDKLNTK